MASPYATNKVNFHPHMVEAFGKQEGHLLNPQTIHLMPQNCCNQDCWFCSYRMEDWKNSQEFDQSKFIPWKKMSELLGDLDRMGVKAIELTGGGEPLLYPYIKKLLKSIAYYGFDLGLVTNGTLLTDEIVDLLYECNLLWARVSIDAGTAEDYAKIRRIKPEMWDQAWKGVKRLTEHDEANKVIIGIGHITSEENYKNLDKFFEMCHIHCVNNVRLGTAFSPRGSAILNDEQLNEIDYLVKEARKHYSRLMIINLIRERVENLQAQVQDYDYCGTKDILCVIEGECRVYTCCTLTGSDKGLVGTIDNQSFATLWKNTQEFRHTLNPRKLCTCECLYEERNMTILDLMNPPPHVNFI